jgi:hypothetical protein
MVDFVEERLESFDSNQVSLYRLVNGNDVVTKVPPSIFGFKHLGSKVIIDKDGRIVVKQKGTLSCPTEVEEDTDCSVAEASQVQRWLSSEYKGSPANAGIDKEQQEYDRFVKRIPRALRDHMPDFYLKPLLRACGVEHGSIRSSKKPQHAKLPIKDESKTASESSPIKDESKTASELSPTRKWFWRRSKKSSF